MKASEGKLGRAFLIRLEAGDVPGESIERFAREKGIQAAQVYFIGKESSIGILAPDSEGIPNLRLPNENKTIGGWDEGEVMIQELLGISFRRVLDPASGKQTLSHIASTKTRVMEKPAPAPTENGPGSIPVYLFNAEFN